MGSFFLWVRDILHLYFAHTFKFLASKIFLILPGCAGAIVLGKYENCHLVLKDSFGFFLVCFLVLFSSVFGSLVLFSVFILVL